jgi:serine/threonine-protein kinase
MTATLMIADRPEPSLPSAVKPVPPAPPPAPPLSAEARLETPAQASTEQKNLPTAAPGAAPAPAPEARLEAPQRPADRERRFVQSYAGGDCFLVEPLPGAHVYVGVGDKLEPFRKFEEAFKRELGAEPQLSVRPITAPECPAIELLRPGASGVSNAPRIELADYSLRPNMPLSGKILNLGGRQAYLVLVDNDGGAYRLDVKTQPGSDFTTFSIPLTPDAASTGPPQVVLAIVSSKPIPALDSFRSGQLKVLAPALLEEARSGSAAVGANFFTFVK